MKKTLFFLIGLLVTLSCNYSQTELPIKLDDGWEIASMRSVGIDAEKIYQLTKQIDDGKYEGQRSLIVVKDGNLVYEAYYDGYDRESLHRIYSVSKSVTSILIGIAIDKGFIEGVDEPLVKLLPKYAAILNNSNKYEITLKNVLTMSPGFEWDEESISFSDSRNSHTQMSRTKDWAKFALSRPLVYEPGIKWIYNTGNTHLLGVILKTKTGLHANEFAEKYLFEPLRIKKYKWNSDPMGYPCVGGSNGGLRLSTRDFAKIGQMMLDGGKWMGVQVVSQKWVDESTTIHINATNISKYGYQWWRDKYKIKGAIFKAICGYGYGGQSLRIFPDLNLVIAMTSWSKSSRAQTLPALLRILNATVKQDK